MKLTNKKNLPQVFVNLVQRDEYTKKGSRLSITEAIGSARISLLKNLHKNQLVEDVVDRYYAIMGTMMHKVLEVGIDESDTTISEERLYTEVKGWTLSGAIDVQQIEDDGVIIQDYKYVGVYSVIMGEQPKPDWVKQLNSYAYMVRKAKGLKVKKLEIIAIFRDHKANNYQQKEDYPDAPIQVIDIPLWSEEEQDKFVEGRVLEHQKAVLAHMEGKELPLCSKDDTWAKDDKYAVMKKKRVRALKVYDNKEEAEKALKDNDHDDYYIEERKSEPIRCLNYCNVSKYCSQFKKWEEENVS
jgi:hypothetical protein|tara:strand:+ start:2598 stop:3494 length:897 start_codon:yes stop_codon:yes gene_type:complete